MKVPFPIPLRLVYLWFKSLLKKMADAHFSAQETFHAFRCAGNISCIWVTHFMLFAQKLLISVYSTRVLDFYIHCNFVSDGPNMLRSALQNVLDDP